MKRLLILVFMCLILPINIKALQIDNTINLKSDSKESLVLYANLKQKATKVKFVLSYSSYDAKADFTPKEEYTLKKIDAMTYEITFNEEKTGKIELGIINISVVKEPIVKEANIMLSNAKAYYNNNTYSLNSAKVLIKLNQTEPQVEEKITSNLLLKEIKSNIVKISLEDNKYDYKVSIPNNIKELDLIPIAIDSSYTVEIPTQKISELEDDTLTITVTKNKIKQTYKIKVDAYDKISIDKTSKIKQKDFKKPWLYAIISFTCVLFALIIFKKRK